MELTLPLPLYKKLTVTFRVEPGCLGPTGVEHVEDFCKYAKVAFKGFHSDFVRWVIIPRYDKSLPETEYKTNNKGLDHNKAALYLQAFEQDLDEFEEHFQEKLSVLIEEFFGR